MGLRAPCQSVPRSIPSGSRAPEPGKAQRLLIDLLFRGRALPTAPRCYPRSVGVRQRQRAALGFSVHTGWAALVAVAGTGSSSVVLQRRRVELFPGPYRFAYHAAQKLDLPAAERLVRETAQTSGSNAETALRAALEALGAESYDVVGAGLPVGARPVSEPLETILQSHARVHAAEGELYRSSVRDASTALGLPVTEVRARELPARAARALGVSAGSLDELLARVGRAAGRPWAKDQRDACLAAWIALAG